MLVAHIPAGYLLTTSLLQRCGGLTELQKHWLLWLGLLAATLPDFDLLYFHLVDHRGHNHHSYWTHLPLFWLVLLLPVYALATARRRPALRWACGILFCNVLLHCVLDSIASGIQWLYPLSRQYFALLPAHGNGGWGIEQVILCCALLELTIICCALRRLQRWHRVKAVRRHP